MAAPLIEAADINTDGSDTITSPIPCVSVAYNTNDLIIVCLATDQDKTHTTPTGPNSETCNVIALNVNSDPGGPRISVWYYIATDSRTGTTNVTVSTSEQYVFHVARVPTGEFLSATPIQTNVGTSTGSSTAPATGAFTSDATAGGRICSFVAIDTQDITGTVTGWTVQKTENSFSRVGSIFTTRDAANTASESVSAAAYSSSVSDTWASITFIINAPASGTTPHSPFGLPLHGPFRGPI